MKRTPLRRSSPLPRGKGLARKKRLKVGNAYCRKEWRQLTAAVRKRSGGICEVCGLRPATGDAHHRSYAPFKGWRRLIVPMDQLVAVCRPCHLAFHQESRCSTG